MHIADKLHECDSDKEGVKNLKILWTSSVHAPNPAHISPKVGGNKWTRKRDWESRMHPLLDKSLCGVSGGVTLKVDTLFISY